MSKFLAVFFIVYELVKILFPLKESELRNNTAKIKENIFDEGATLHVYKTPLWHVYNCINITYGAFCIFLLLSLQAKYMLAGVALLLLSSMITKNKSTPKLVTLDSVLSITILASVFIA